jgi:ribosome maturation factor RimP
MQLIEQREGMEKKFFDLCQKVVHDNQLELYDLEYFPGNGQLRLFIMNPQTGSALIEDCVKIDHALTPFIDSETWMPSRLTLEVSSPGLFRTLRTREHFQMNIGRPVLAVIGKMEASKLATLPKEVKTRRQILGTLQVVESEGFVLETQGQKYQFNFLEIKQANIEPNINFSEEEV